MKKVPKSWWTDTCIDTIRHGVTKPSARLTCIPLITPISKESELKVEVLVAWGGRKGAREEKAEAMALCPALPPTCLAFCPCQCQLQPGTHHSRQRCWFLLTTNTNTSTCANSIQNIFAEKQHYAKNADNEMIWYRLTTENMLLTCLNIEHKCGPGEFEKQVLNYMLTVSSSFSSQVQWHFVRTTE